MSRRYGKHSSQGMRNLQSAGLDAAKFTGRVTEDAAVGLARWATTDHSGIGKALGNMPSMGFFDSLGYIFMCLIVSLGVILLKAVIIFCTVFFTFAIWIPFLLGLLGS